MNHTLLSTSNIIEEIYQRDSNMYPVIIGGEINTEGCSAFL